MYRMEDTPERVGQAVRATFKGSGTSKILLIAHMDTVYLKGMAEKQPFRLRVTRLMGLPSPMTSRGSPLSCTRLRC